MANRTLPIWKTFIQALIAPFCLNAASWGALAGPALAVVLLNLLPFALHYSGGGAMMSTALLLPAWAAGAWFALAYLRQLLLGSAESASGPNPWQRYGLSLLLLFIVSLFLAMLIALLMFMVLPGIAVFLMAINSPDPWLVTGAMVLWAAVAIAGAWPAVRFALILPAATVGHDITPGHVWRLSVGKGMRLLVLLIIIPGFFQGILSLVFEEQGGQAWSGILAIVLRVYFVLVELSILGLAYRALSDQPLPENTPRAHRGSKVVNRRILWPLLLVFAVTLGVVASRDMFYRLDPDEYALIFRGDSTARIESEPGVQMKIPALEKARVIKEGEHYRASGSGRYLTVAKEILPVQYTLDWQITDPQRFTRATAGKVWMVEDRLRQVAEEALRDRIARLDPDELQNLSDEGPLDFAVNAQPGGDTTLANALEDINERAGELGVRVSAWQLHSAGDGERQPD